MSCQFDVNAALADSGLFRDVTNRYISANKENIPPFDPHFGAIQAVDCTSSTHRPPRSGAAPVGFDSFASTCNSNFAGANITRTPGRCTPSVHSMRDGGVVNGSSGAAHANVNRSLDNDHPSQPAHQQQEHSSSATISPRAQRYRELFGNSGAINSTPHSTGKTKHDQGTPHPTDVSFRSDDMAFIVNQSASLNISAFDETPTRTYGGGGGLCDFHMTVEEVLRACEESPSPAKHSKTDIRTATAAAPTSGDGLRLFEGPDVECAGIEIIDARGKGYTARDPSIANAGATSASIFTAALTDSEPRAHSGSPKSVAPHIFSTSIVAAAAAMAQSSTRAMQTFDEAGSMTNTFTNSSTLNFSNDDFLIPRTVFDEDDEDDGSGDDNTATTMMISRAPKPHQMMAMRGQFNEMPPATFTVLSSCTTASTPHRSDPFAVGGSIDELFAPPGFSAPPSYDAACNANHHFLASQPCAMPMTVMANQYEADATGVRGVSMGSQGSSHTASHSCDGNRNSAVAGQCTGDTSSSHVSRRAKHMSNVKASAGSLIAIGGRRVPVDKLHLLKVPSTSSTSGSGESATDLSAADGLSSAFTGVCRDVQGPSARRKPASTVHTVATTATLTKSSTPSSTVKTTITTGTVLGGVTGPSSRPMPGHVHATVLHHHSEGSGKIVEARQCVSPLAGTLSSLTGKGAHLHRDTTSPSTAAAAALMTSAVTPAFGNEVVVVLRFAKGGTMRFLCNYNAAADVCLRGDGVNPSVCESAYPLDVQVGCSYLAHVYASRSPFDNTAFEDVGVCVQVIRPRSPVASAGRLVPQCDGMPDVGIADGVILRSADVARNAIDMAAYCRIQKLEAEAFAECERNFCFLNLPFQLQGVHYTFDMKLCIVYYHIAAKSDTSSDPNVPRLLRVLQYQLHCRVCLQLLPL